MVDQPSGPPTEQGGLLNVLLRLGKGAVKSTNVPSALWQVLKPKSVADATFKTKDIDPVTTEALLTDNIWDVDKNMNRYSTPASITDLDKKELRNLASNVQSKLLNPSKLNPSDISSYKDQEGKLMEGMKISADGFLLNKKGHPLKVYHSTLSPETFKEFTVGALSSYNDLENPGDKYPFLSTSENPDVAHQFGLAAESIAPNPATEGARIIPGTVKAKKPFDFRNPVSVNEVIKTYYEESLATVREGRINTVKKAIESLLQTYHLPEWETTNEKMLNFIRIQSPEVYDKLISGKLITQGKKGPHQIKTPFKPMSTREGKKIGKEIRKVMLDEYKKKWQTVDRVSVGQKILDEKIKMERGLWGVLEQTPILNILRQKGYDSFFVKERATQKGLNIMLFNPKEQFIPLYDPKRESTLGFKSGGRVERNPYNYKPRAI